MLTIQAADRSPARGLRGFVYGGTNSGKTELISGIVRLAPGRHLYIDTGEGSTTSIPFHRYTDAEPYGLVLLTPDECGRVIVLLDDEVVRAAKGEGRYDAIAVDSVTEQSYNESQRQERLFIARYRGKEAADERTLKRWGETLAALVAIIQRLVVLSNYGISTWATAAATMGQDPEISQGREARPLAAGGIKDLIGRYFDLQIYVEQATENKLPVHIYHMIRDGAWQIGNRWERAWIAEKLPTSLKNPKLEDVLQLVQRAVTRNIHDFAGGNKIV